MFPIEKYKFVERTLKDGRIQIIALSSYAGKTVRGVATCSTEDNFNKDTGKQLAALRCDLKVAEKRMSRAAEKRAFAAKELARAMNIYNNNEAYQQDAIMRHNLVKDELEKLISKL